ncbi:hypothetical protein MRX96_028552 [Rhipicephalus microplus]
MCADVGCGSPGGSREGSSVPLGSLGARERTAPAPRDYCLRQILTFPRIDGKTFVFSHSRGVSRYPERESVFLFSVVHRCTHRLVKPRRKGFVEEEGGEGDEEDAQRGRSPDEEEERNNIGRLYFTSSTFRGRGSSSSPRCLVAFCFAPDVQYKAGPFLFLLRLRSLASPDAPPSSRTVRSGASLRAGLLFFFFDAPYILCVSVDG